jgi:hypothetical protein
LAARAGAGRIDRRYYELCVLRELRAALRDGDAWLEGSRRYTNPESYLIPPVGCPDLRSELCALTQNAGRRVSTAQGAAG